MRKLMLIFAAVVGLSGVVNAQKFAVADEQELVIALPEYDSASKKLEAKAAELQGSMMQIQKEYETKVMEYQKLKKDPATSLSILQFKEQEITSLQQSYQQYQQNAQVDLQNYEAQLLEPVQTRLVEVIENYAKANGYDAVYSKAGMLYSNFKDVTEDIKATF